MTIVPAQDRRLIAGVLALMTVAACVAAVISEVVIAAWELPSPGLGSMAMTLATFIGIQVLFSRPFYVAWSERYAESDPLPLSVGRLRREHLRPIAGAFGWLLAAFAASVAASVIVGLAAPSAPRPIMIGVGGGVFLAAVCAIAMALRAKLGGE